MNGKRLFCLLAALVMGFCLFGCDRTPAPAPDDPIWEPSAPEKTDLTQLLTAEEVSEAVGTTVGAGTLQDGGTVLSFSSEDYAVQVVLLVEEPVGDAETYFEAVTGNYEEGALSPAPNLGKTAYWCGTTGELLVCGEGQVFSLNIMSEEMGEETRLIAARQLAVLVLGRLG